MTNIRIHGQLGKIFGSRLRVHLGRMNDIFLAIDAIREGFRKKVVELQEKGFSYSICPDGEGVLHILPMIVGTGKIGAYIAAAVLIVVGVILCVFQQYYLGTPLITAGISLTIQTALMKTPKLRDIKASTGGNSAAVTAAGRSYIFANDRNITSQGIQVPLGYGRFKVAPAVINASVKNYSLSERFDSLDQSLATPPSLND